MKGREERKIGKEKLEVEETRGERKREKCREKKKKIENKRNEG